MVHTQGQNLSNHNMKQYLDIHETNKCPTSIQITAKKATITLP